MTRAEQVNIRLSATERRLLDRAAKQSGLPLSEWVRLAALWAAGRCPFCGVGSTSRARIPHSTPDDGSGNE